MFLRNVFLTKSLAIFSLLLTFSCSYNSGFNNAANKNFEQKFGQDVAAINASRSYSQAQESLAQESSAPTRQASQDRFSDPASEIGISGAQNNYSAKIDTSKLKIKKPQNFTPDAQTLSQGKNVAPQSQLPDDIFDMNYNTQPHPPFVIAGLEFDSIDIPKKDFYGVKSTLDDKQYFLAGNDTLQKNIDRINRSRDIEEIEISKTLIKEQKEIRQQQKIAKIFKEDSSVVEKQKIKDENEEKEKEAARLKKLSEEDPIKKAIALQVIQQNLKQSKAAADAAQAAQ